MMSILQDLEPKSFFKWFEPLTQIPRPTFHEEKAADFVEEYARQHRYEYSRDDHNNVIIYVPATPGYENEPSMLLQAHLDMVAAKDEGVEFDFEKDPIQLRIVNGNDIMGTGTTLGADDGGGVAAMLAVGDDPEVKHPPLELLFTTAEEQGFVGIRHFDFSKIHSKRMINFDSGRVHSIGVSSVGSDKIELNHSFTAAPADGTAMKVHLYNGKNGHAGLDAFRNRACAANAVGRMLFELEKKMEVRLADVTTVKTGIISDFSVTFFVPAGKDAEAASLLKTAFEQINRLYQETDPDLILDIDVCEAEKKALSAQDSYKVIDLMVLLETGTTKSHPDDRNYLIASQCLVEIRLHGTELYVLYSTRSGEDNYCAYMTTQAMEIIRLLGFKAEITNSYTGWLMKRGSKMIELVDRKHREVFGYEAGHRHIHGGIELGMITGAIPEMDAVAVIPSLVGAHTTSEALFIDQVPDFWALLKAVLAAKAE